MRTFTSFYVHNCICLSLLQKNTYYHSGNFYAPPKVMHSCFWSLQIMGNWKNGIYLIFFVPILKMIHPNIFFNFLHLTFMHLWIKKSHFWELFRPLSQFQSKQTQQKIIIGFPAMWSLPEKWKKVLAVLPLMKLKKHTHTASWICTHSRQK